MTRDHCLADAVGRFDDGRFLAELAARVACRTESDAPGAHPGLADYLRRQVAEPLAALGFESELFDNPVAGAPPLLVAQRIEDPALPTVLTYGHADVVGPAGAWREGLDPWTLTVDGERWYGRGTADNKGQHAINLAGLAAAIAARHGRLGFNVKVLMESGEEVGSPGLRAFCEAQAARLAADLFVASDGPRNGVSRPTVFTGSRGGVNFMLTLAARDRACHSGNWGGVLSNPATVLSHAIATMVDRNGRLRVEGLRPPPLSAAMRAALAEVAIGADPGDPALSEGWGEPGLSPAERLVGWNTLEVLALDAGNPARPVNAIPPKAVAHLQLRFVVGTRWQALAEIVRAHLDAQGFPEIEVAVGMQMPATRLDPESPWIGWALRSIQASTGVRPVLLPNLAGTLPNEVFAQVLGLPTLWVPHSHPACGQHGPDEHLLAPLARQGLAAMAGLYWDLGEPVGTQGAAPWVRAAQAR